MKKIAIFLSIHVTFFWFTIISKSFGAAPAPALSPNILLITIDTLRPDHLGCYGYEPVKTPHIDDLAKDGVLFMNAFSPVPLTLPSHVSMMTGQYPIQHGIHNNGDFSLPDSANTLAEILQGKGYTTGAVVASYVLASSCGLSQGFVSYDDDMGGNPGEMVKKHDGVYREGETVTQIAQKWLLKNHEKPFFLWVHYFDPHYPYEPPAPFDTEYKNLPYDGEIAFTDQCLGRLFAEMQKQNIMDNTFIIFVGDHGEGLWEHNEQAHGLFIYDTTLKVPLIMRYPKLISPGGKVTSLAATIDIIPTILESLKIRPKDNKIQGKSLIPILTGKKKAIRQILYCESYYAFLNFNWSPLEGIITDEGWKYIQAPKPELYNLKDDPKEKTNLCSKNSRKIKHLRGKLLGLKKELLLKSGSQSEAIQTFLSPETEEKLKSLGYIRGRRGNNAEIKNMTEQSASLLPDPKDRAQLLAQIDRGRELEAKGESAEAIRLFQEVLSQDPNNNMAHYWLGLTYRSTGRPRKAVNEFQKLAELDPGYYDCLNILGSLYDLLALPECAIQAYKDALEVNPSSAIAHSNLGVVYLKMNALDLAQGEFQKALALPSDDQVFTSMVFANLGEIDNRRGDLKGAAEKFKHAIGLNQFNRDAHIRLADGYFRLKDKEKSLHAWEEITELWPDDYIACYKAAELSLAVDKSGQAAYYLRKCLQIRPDYIDARLLLQQIPRKPH